MMHELTSLHASMSAASKGAPRPCPSSRKTALRPSTNAPAPAPATRAAFHTIPLAPHGTFRPLPPAPPPPSRAAPIPFATPSSPFAPPPLLSPASPFASPPPSLSPTSDFAAALRPSPPQPSRLSAPSSPPRSLPRSLSRGHPTPPGALDPTGPQATFFPYPSHLIPDDPAPPPAPAPLLPHTTTRPPAPFPDWARFAPSPSFNSSLSFAPGAVLSMDHLDSHMDLGDMPSPSRLPPAARTATLPFPSTRRRSPQGLPRAGSIPASGLAQAPTTAMAHAMLPMPALGPSLAGSPSWSSATTTTGMDPYAIYRSEQQPRGPPPPDSSRPQRSSHSLTAPSRMSAAQATQYSLDLHMQQRRQLAMQQQQQQQAQAHQAHQAQQQAAMAAHERYHQREAYLAFGAGFGGSSPGLEGWAAYPADGPAGRPAGDGYPPGGMLAGYLPDGQDTLDQLVGAPAESPLPLV
ncbi:hypothetical protein WOLCODRAFT_129340 [Wolfiporia cocos MD-104 SS10]|uniref:Uncharacterized protein n=1 Tax=Wolfiporia cocos (strain MD-104) TaxID=742152 RepID=A0A2H3JB96_WOLCO|nr:hypothetical protein WOLCODRAFT_129340 [Wolfiporia cocos MD-104 SS10]